jgi:hypothetical protein
LSLDNIRVLCCCVFLECPYQNLSLLCCLPAFLVSQHGYCYVGMAELGINFTQISRKMLTVVNPFRRVMHLHEDADLAGPFIFCILFGVCQILAGKLHFGVILGWTSLASLYMYMVLNLLVGRYGSLDLYHCGSLVGYSLLPMVIFSLLSIFVPGRGVLEFILAVLTVIWCTRSCTTLMIDLVPNAEEYRSLIAYPCGLIYTAFCLLVIF